VQAAQINGVTGTYAQNPVNHQVDVSSLHNQLSLIYQSTRIHGLRPFSSYNVSLYAINEVEFCEGPGPSSTNVTMKTIRPTLPDSPSKVEFVSHTSGGALKLKITPPLDRGGHDYLEYDIAYRQVITAGGSSIVGSNDWIYDHARDGSVVHTNTLTTTIVNLIPFTTYEMKVRSVIPAENENSYTLNPTGCECAHDKKRTDCACCSANGVQCGSKARMLCVSPNDVRGLPVMNDACNGDVVRSNRAYVMSNTNKLDYSTLDVTTVTYDYSQFTFEAWVTVPSSTEATASSNKFVLWRIRQTTDSNTEGIVIGYLNKKIYVKDLSDSDTIESSKSVLFGNGDNTNIDGKWVHVAVTRDSNDNSVRLYIDGFFSNSGTLADLSTNSVGGTPLLMDGYVESPTTLKVHIDDVRVFLELRSLDKIRSQMVTPLLSNDIKTSTIRSTFNKHLYSSTNMNVVDSDRLRGPWSNTISMATVAPTEAEILTAPTITDVSGGGGLVKWQNRDDYGGQAVTGYKLFISEPNGNTCVKRAFYEVPTGTEKQYSLQKFSETTDISPYYRSIRVVRLLPSKTYKICIGISNGFEPKKLSPMGTLITSIATKPGTPPSPTQNISALTKWDELAIQWELPADVGGVAVTGFILEKNDGADMINGWLTPTGWTNGELKFGFLDIGLNPEHAYYYRIKAINSVGTSVHGPNLMLMSKSACPHYFYPTGKCNTFSLCELQDGQDVSDTARTFCNDLTKTQFVSARFGDDTNTGSAGTHALSSFPSSEASPVRSFTKAITLLATKPNVVLYPADDFNDINNDCGTTISDGKVGHFLGFNSTIEVDGTKTSGSRISCPMSSISQSYTRALIIQSSSQITFEGIEFIHAGIEIKDSSSKLILKRVVFSKMKGLSSVGGDNYGSALNIHTNSIVDIHSVSIMVSSSKYGGALSIRGSSTLNICGLSLFNNHASVSGGAMYIDSSTINMINACVMITNVENNRATSYGGGMYITGTSTLNSNALLNITKNIASLGGGGIAVMGNNHDVNINGNSLSVVGNEASKSVDQGESIYENGGGIFVQGVNGDSTWNDVVLSNNIGGHGGNMMINMGAKVAITNMLVEKGTAHASGGGLYVHKASLALLTSNIKNNHAFTDGGGIAVVDGSVRLKGITMDSNRANGNGGAIHAQTSTVNNEVNATLDTLTNKNQVHVSSSTFKGSVVGSSGKGGHVSLSHTNASFIIGCVFETTTSEHGGAFHVSTTKLLLNAGTQIKNTKSKQNGGGIYATKGSNVHLESVLMVGVSSLVDGGALYADEHSKVNVTNSVITKPIAGRNGGTMVLSSGSIGAMSNTEIVSSSANMNGGVYHVSTGVVGSTYDLSSLVSLFSLYFFFYLYWELYSVLFKF
jgi:predicted outer membrane repeat protein